MTAPTILPAAPAVGASAAGPREFDLQPHPRILAMLGEINLPQWRCVAELVDNAVDGFLQAHRAGQPVATPQVYVNLPTADTAGAKVTVRDNGPGMSPTTLQSAVRAGWSGNDAIHNLGLFGMGLNIATAKLGRVTEVWTARPEDAEWCGVRIDFDALARQGHFRTEALTRAKIDPAEHGTEILVTALKPDQRQFFAKANNRAQIGKLLGEAYGAMLRPGGEPLEFSLTLNGPRVTGWQHCVWGANGSDPRSVKLAPPLGDVDAFQAIDRTLPPRPFCQTCWEWLPDGTTRCTACGSADVVERERRIHGWLGIQRYLHPTEYGIDLLRNGRKIEIKSKELFTWVNPDGTEELEYPIDDHRRLGRIVGEIHLDHCRVSYMKDRFERTDVAWADMVRVVRGEGPLRPEIAREKGYPANSNTSPLFKLYQAFRRSSPYKKQPGCYAKLILVPPEQNDRAKEMGELFRRGDPRYQTDAAWWALVEQADTDLLTQQTGTGMGTGAVGGATSAGSSNTLPNGTPNVFAGNGAAPAGGAAGAGPLPGFGVAGGAASGGAAAATNGLRPGQGGGAGPAAAAPVRTGNAALSQKYREPVTGQAYEVRALAAADGSDPALAGGLPWALRADAASGTFDLVYFPGHVVFQSSTMTPLDALLSELASAIVEQQRSLRSGADTRFAAVLASLRDEYAGATQIDPVALAGQAAAVLGDVAKRTSEHLAEGEGAALFDELTMGEREAIVSRMVTRQVQNPSAVLAAGRFLEFASSATLLKVFGRYPELFFDGRCWEDPYSTLDLPTDAATEQAREERARYHAGLLMDAAWLAASEPSALVAAPRARVLRSAWALELLAPDEP